MSKRDRLAGVIDSLREFRFCGPSDDPEALTAVTSGYRYLVVQLQRLAAPLLPETEAARLDAINVEIDNLYSAYDARAEVDALLPDVEAALEQSDDNAFSVGANAWVVEPSLIDRLAGVNSSRFDVAFLVQLCREMNSSFARGNIVATVLLMRGVLNYIPPVFGQETFGQVVANSGKSLRDSFDHLEQGLRKVADFQAHRRIGSIDLYPSRAQVESFKAQFELLLQQVVVQMGAG